MNLEISDSADRNHNTDYEPWLGLAAYTEHEAERFFGRNREIRALTQAILDMVQTTVYGPSGAGKTSLLRAGVFPRLRQENTIPVYVRLDHSPNALSYRDQVVAAVTDALEESKVEIAPLAEPLPGVEGESLWAWFHRNEFWDARNRLVKPVLVLDQFEELFTLGASRPDFAAFIEELGGLCSNTVPPGVKAAIERERLCIEYPIDAKNYRIVLSLREDFLARLEELTTRWPPIPGNRVSVQAMRIDQAMEAVLHPGGALVDETVAHAIVDAVTRVDAAGCNRETAPSVEPAILSLFCARLNRRRIQEGSDTITLQQVNTAREGILQSFYEESMGTVAPETRAYVEDNLLTGYGYRMAQALDDVQHAGIPGADIDTLVACRLLRYDFRQGVRWVEFSHDILTVLAKTSRDQRRADRALEEERRQSERLREERDKHRRQTRLAVGVSFALLLAVVVLLLGGWWYFFKEHHYYFEDYKKVWGTPVGLGKLSRAAVAHREWSLEFTTEGKYERSLIWWSPKARVKRIRAVDSECRPTENHTVSTYLWSTNESHANDDARKTLFTENEGKAAGAVSAAALAKVCQWEFISGEDGRPVYELGKDKQGAIIWGMVYAPADGSEWKKSATIHFVDKDGYPQKQRRDRAEYVRITYTENGQEKWWEFRDSSGRPVPGPDGAHARHHTYDDVGRLVSMTSLEWRPLEEEQDEGRYEPMIDRAGNTGMRFFYKNGRMIRAESFGKDQELRLTNKGWAIVRNRHDNWGNVTEQAYFDNQDKPTLDWEDYTHCARQLYDEKGRKVQIEFFGVDGAPCLHKDGFASFRLEYDERGNIIRQRFFGVDKQPCMTKYGYAVISWEYNEHGNKTSESYFGSDGEPVLDPLDNKHKVEWTYDEQGNNITHTSYFGVDGNPCLHKNRYASFKSEYDDRGNIIRTSYYGVDGNPCLHKDGNASFRLEYDDRGNIIRQSFFGLDDKPLRIEAGYASIKWEYDERGNITCQSYFGLDDKPVRIGAGYASIKWEYDDHGNLTTARYFGCDGAFVTNISLDVHMVESVYNKQGALIRTDYYDVDGRLCENKNRYASFTREYDKRGNPVKESYFDVNGAPCLCLDNFASGTIAYDERDNPIRSRFFGVDGKPCLHKDGYASIIVTYDETGEIEEKKFLDLDGNEMSGTSEMMPAVVIAEISNDSPAAKIGVPVNSILLLYDTWNWLIETEDPGFPLLGQTISSAVDKAKTMVVWDDGTIRQFELAPGIAGIRFADKQLSVDEATAALTDFGIWLASSETLPKETDNGGLNDPAAAKTSP